MSTNIERAEKPTDDEPFNTTLLARHVNLGTDAEGMIHHLDRATATVHRIDPATGRRERRTDLTARNEPAPAALETYIAFVAEGVGWDDRRKYVAADFFGDRR